MQLCWIGLGSDRLIQDYEVLRFNPITSPRKQLAPQIITKHPDCELDFKLNQMLKHNFTRSLIIIFSSIQQTRSPSWVVESVEFHSYHIKLLKGNSWQEKRHAVMSHCDCSIMDVGVLAKAACQWRRIKWSQNKLTAKVEISKVLR